MKSIILAGVPRSGKTTLTMRLHKDIGGSIIAGDMLVKAFDQVFPQLGIRHGIGALDDTSDNLAKFLSAWLDLNARFDYRRFILDTSHLTPDTVVHQKMNDKYTVLFFGYPTITCDEKLAQIHAYRNKFDWAADLTDEKLVPMVEDFIQRSVVLREACTQHGLTFIDTGNDFKAALDRAYRIAIK